MGRRKVGISQIGWLLAAAAACVDGRAQELPSVPAARERATDQRLVLRLSEAALNGLWGNEVIDHQVGVRDCILGTSVHGQARVIGTPRVELIPSRDQAVFRVLFEGRAYSRTTGYNGPAVIYSRTVTDFTAARQIAAASGGGFRAGPTQIWAGTQLTIDGIDSTRRGLVGRIVRRRAGRMEAQQHGEATEIARQKTAGRIAATLDRSSQDRLDRLNQIALFRRLASAAFWAAGQNGRPTYALSTTRDYLQIGVSFEGLRRAGVGSPGHDAASAAGASVELWLHESLLGGRLAAAIDTLSVPMHMSSQLQAVSATAASIAGRWHRNSPLKRWAAEQPVQIRRADNWRVIRWDTAADQRRLVAVDNADTDRRWAAVAARPAAQPPIRTWTSGPYHAEASFVALEGDTVRLLRTSGVRTSIPLEKLSAGDQQWIRDHLASPTIRR